MSAGYRWVACSERDYGTVGHERHLVRVGGTGTACHATASHAAIWRANNVKTTCKRCADSAMGRLYPDDEYDDDRPGMMRVHVAEARARKMMDMYKINGLRAAARTLGVTVDGRTKHDVAWALALAGYQPW